MKLLQWNIILKEYLIQSLHTVKLKGYDQYPIYKDAEISLKKNVDTNTLVPTQRYVLRSGVETILAIHDLFQKERVNIFDLDFGLVFTLGYDNGTEDGPIYFLPPIVEESYEKDGTIRIINDGMHRIAAARLLKRNINIILITGVNPLFPYYAYPLPNGWDDVSTVERLTDNFKRKEYRVPENHKALFRDFNEPFPGIQKERRSV